MIIYCCSKIIISYKKQKTKKNLVFDSFLFKHVSLLKDFLLFFLFMWSVRDYMPFFAFIAEASKVIRKIIDANK